ncbi:2,3-bisphosphoglycerate-independent phosphoglycerate mutase [Pikeienuella sp. HZG-20]|uniref:2,3-bisphosphoglycerate-independent phosphoglycerate mutase n=1 Tax=Paludibacillus litoralis TaxID=3133267 RepID=UPI0030EC2434
MPASAISPVVLCILDGWGWRAEREGNAPAQAHTPNYDALVAAQTPAMLACSGPDVGLPAGQMGNSEVGHMNIGAGRVVWMDLPKIDRAIEDGSFRANPELKAFAAALKASGGTAHLMGLMSPGGVHAHQRHIAEAAKALAAQGIPVALHLFTDGRDTPPTSAAGYLETFEADLGGAGRVATVSGRFYAMDRDKRWERVGAAYSAIVHGEGAAAASAAAAIRAAYERGDTDEFITPTVIGGYKGAAAGDGVLFLNFRADRARELLSALGDPEFDGFAVPGRPRFAAMAGLVEYSERHNAFMSTLFPVAPIVNTLGAWVSAAGRRQLRIAETEKYPHVTFFLNGGEEAPAVGETRVMAPSPKVRTYDLAPEMAAAEVTAALVEGIEAGHDLIVVNYANPDMVGHTGDLQAAIRACEAVDEGLGAALAALRRAGGAMIVTADHGNCEMMIDPETGGSHTAHTVTPVAALLAGVPGAALAGPGRLADLAPTLLDLMGLAPPPEMTGRSLLVR